jgi:hypothetical protein
MAGQPAMQSVFTDGVGADVLYARGRNSVDVLKGAVKVIQRLLSRSNS